jgi:hypothetical protein
MSGQEGRAALWDGRLRLIARRIRPGASVLDLGAGAQSLRGMLPPLCRYTPADREQRTPDTLLFDMDTGVYPDGRWDVAVMAGVLEYAPNAWDVVTHLADLAPLLLLSYDHGGSLDYRRRQGWQNHLSRAGLEDLLEDLGYRYRLVARWQGRLIYEAHT